MRRGGVQYDSERPGPRMGGRTSPLGRGEYQKDRGVWRQLSAWVRSNLPGAVITSAFRQTRTATGKVSNHARGLAVDIAGPNMMRYFNAIREKFGSRSLELIHSQAGGRQIYHGRPHMYTGVTRANHFDHVHWSMPSFDGPADFGGGDFLGGLTDFITGPAMKLLDGMPKASPWSDIALEGLKKLPAAAWEKVQSMMSFLPDFGGSKHSGGNAPGGVQRWAPLVEKALGMLGQPTSLVQTVLRRMNQESSGNPRAINLWDSNAKRGIPSKGLMQVIDPTFRQYAMSGYNSSIYDPLSNILASMRYAMSRYGSLSRAYNRAGGYALGTLNATAGPHLVGERGPELVSFRGGERVTPTHQLMKAAAGPALPDQITLVDASGALLGRMEVVAGEVTTATLRSREHAARVSEGVGL